MSISKIRNFVNSEEGLETYRVHRDDLAHRRSSITFRGRPQCRSYRNNWRYRSNDWYRELDLHHFGQDEQGHSY